MVATPATAATSTFASTTDIFVDDNVVTATNATAISIPDSGVASVYPSAITVTHNARISDLNVTLFDVSHTWPDDINVLLVGPHGQQVTLISDAGGGADAGEDFVVDDLTFDDSAATLVPDETAPNLNNYRPTNYGAGDIYPAPAPDNTSSTSLADFNGTLAAGTWQLWVYDDEAPDNGQIAGGWELDFTLLTDPYPSTIAVSGLPAISDVNVGLQGINSAALDDLNLFLVGPAGQQSYLIGDAGGFTDLSNVSITFDDEAAGPVADNDPPVNGGSYKPFYQGDFLDFPDPAPVQIDSSVLSVFDGISPNGQWQLWAQDDSSGNTLTTISGWSLSFTWADNQVPTGTVAVNGGAASTTSANVTLNLAATDPAPASGVKEMRFSNDGVTFSAYQPYAVTAAWALSGGDGTRTVYAQFRDGDGNVSAVASDAITLDTTGPKAKKLTPKKNAKGVKTTTKVKIKASEALKGSTVTKKNVFLKQKGVSGKIKAKVKYNSAKKLIVLTPVDDLKGGKTYKVTVKNVQDAFGHKWDEKPSKSGAQALKYSFTTA